MFALKDAALKATLALPNAASTTVKGAGVDTGVNSSRSDLVARFEFLLTYPTVTTTMAPDGDTISYSIVESTDNATWTVKYPNVVVQTGAGGAGAAGGTFRFRESTLPARYVGVQIVSGSGITNSSSLSATLEMMF